MDCLHEHFYFTGIRGESALYRLPHNIIRDNTKNEEIDADVIVKKTEAVIIST